MRKTAVCICKIKGADQLCSNCAADQHLCFCFIDSTIPLLSITKISSLQPSSVVVQPSLCQAWWKTQKTGFRVTWLKVPSLLLNLFLGVGVLRGESIRSYCDLNSTSNNFSSFCESVQDLVEGGTFRMISPNLCRKLW